ncbi:MAG: hypothetical protein JOZ77_10695 [Candidatus Eremiobacteraeota bacterium]|nr:hypothetical protein [Candidatus Eremiobacteraeota bacterium]
MRVHHDDLGGRQGSAGAAEKPGASMSETQIAAVSRLEERLDALKERL